MTVRYKFTARAGEYLTGVPAKDLTDNDLDAMSPEQVRLLDANLKGDRPLYEAQGKGGQRLSAKLPEGIPMRTRDLAKEGNPNWGFTEPERLKKLEQSEKAEKAQSEKAKE